MGERDIEKYFKDGLKGYSKDVDTNAIWSALDLEEKRKNKRFFAWPLSLLLIVVFATSYFVLNRNKSSQEIEQSIKETLVEQGEANELQSIPAVSISNASEGNSGNVSSISAIEVPETQFHQLKVNSSFQKDISVSQNKSTEPLDKVTPVTDYINEANQAVLSPTRENDQYAILENEPIENDQIEFPIEKSNSLSNPIIQSLLKQPHSLENNYAQPFTIDDRAVPVSNDFEVDLPKNASSRALRLNVYSGIYNIDRTLTSQSMELDQFMSRKEESESPLELVSFGIQLRYDIGSVYFKGGIEFQSLNQKFEYEQYSIVDTVPTPGVVGILIDSNGNSLNQIGTVYEENSLTSSWTNYNSHRLFNLPLAIGYEKTINKWSYFIEAQSQINFHHSFTGKRLDQEGNVTDNSIDINKSIKLGLGAAIGLRYEYSKATSIYLSPIYFSYLDSFAHKSSAYSEKYGLLGLQIGLSYKLF